MVVDTEQFCRLRSAFEAEVSDLDTSALAHGVMLEVPSACFQARELLREAEFGCIGSNDLLQYLFAYDRCNNQLFNDGEYSFHPVVWRLIEFMGSAAEKAGKPISLCGELASLPEAVRRLMDLGINAISTVPRNIASVRRMALSISRVKQTSS